MEKQGRFGFRAWLLRVWSAALIGGQTFVHIIEGRIDRRNTIDQMQMVGPDSLGIVVLTAVSVGSAFAIQVAKEFDRYGASNAIGGIMAIAMARELIPVVTALVLTGRVGSAFAAEIGTMQVTEQIDALYMLKTDPVDYLVVPRWLACLVMLPTLNIFGFAAAMVAGMIVTRAMVGVSFTGYIESINQFLSAWDIFSSLIKSAVFGTLMAAIGCTWGLTTTGGAKGVGQSTTSAVVTSLLSILVANFFLSWLMFQNSRVV